MEFLTCLNEEEIRQQWIHYAIHRKGYPEGYLVVEQALHTLPYLQGRVRLPQRRLDLLIMAPQPGKEYLWPLLLMECKRGPLQPQHIQQVLGYNGYVQAPFVAVANGEEIRCGKADMDPQYWISSLPTYSDLLSSLLQP